MFHIIMCPYALGSGLLMSRKWVDYASFNSGTIYPFPRSRQKVMNSQVEMFLVFD